MSFTDFFIKRPVFATALSLLLLLIGLVCFKHLSLREFPKVASNTIDISATYTGASASVMESFVTTPIEDALSGISGLDYMDSTSGSGFSSVTLHLKLNSDLNAAMIDVQSKVSSVFRSLPSGVDDPTISSGDNSGPPGVIIGFSSKARSRSALVDYLKRVVSPALSNVDGVSDATVWGPPYAMRLWLDVNKMRALNISASDVEDALDNDNIESTPGQILRQQQVITIDAKTGLHTAKQFNNLVIKKVGNNLIRLKDIGHAELSAANTTISVFFDGNKGVGMGLNFKSTANPLVTSTEVRKALANLHLPADIHAAVVRDGSIYIKASIEEVLKTFFITILFVILVIFAFLGSLRLVVIPLVTIPLSIIGAFILMFMLNYSVNTLTMLAFILAIGMVVDDAIVVMENIHRYLLQKLSIKEAAMQGARQISFAIISMTITLMAVYAPIGFTGGVTGALFREFAFTLAGAVLISGWIALTLTPMMCSQILNLRTYESPLAKSIDRFMLRLTGGYKKILLALLVRKYQVLIVMVVVFLCGAIFLFPLLRTSGMAPSEDIGGFFGIAQGPTAASSQYMEKYTKEIGKIYNSVPEKANSFIVNGGGPNDASQNSAFTVLTLQPWSERKRSAQQIMASIKPKIDAIPGIRTILVVPPLLPGSGGGFYPFNFVVTTTGSYQDLAKVVGRIVKEASKNPHLGHMNSQLKFDQPQLAVKVDRDKAAYLGVTMDDIDNALSIALGEPETGQFSRDGYSYYIIPQLIKQQYSTSNILDRIPVRTESGTMVPLSTLISVDDSVASSSLYHYEGQRAAVINVPLQSGYSMQQAIDYFSNLADGILDKNMSYTFSGSVRSYMQTQNTMLMVFIAALLVIYLVLAAQFESFRDPLVILVTVPLAITGALGGLLFSGGTLNIYTQIGLVTLIGLISKHGILMVEFAKQCRLNDGMSASEAIVHSASIRLRPILMTTAAMVLGSVPLIFSAGAGAHARQELGWVIASGMLIGTLFTLFILPTVYLLIPGGAKVSKH